MLELDLTVGVIQQTAKSVKEETRRHFGKYVVTIWRQTLSQRTTNTLAIYLKGQMLQVSSGVYLNASLNGRP